MDIPRVGLGTHKLIGDDCKIAVSYAINNSLCHIDTATCYRNESDIGNAIRNSPRESLYITSKLAPKEMKPGRIKEFVENLLVRLFQNVQGSYLDLLLLHWPGISKIPRQDPRHRDIRLKVWLEMEQLVDEGKLRAIGVSNFERRHLEELISFGERRYPIFCNQIEVHPKCQRKALRSFMREHDIKAVHYSPLGTGDLIHDPIIEDIFKSEQLKGASGWNDAQASPVWVLLLWGLQVEEGILIPKTKNPQHLSSIIRLRDLYKCGEIQLLEDNIAKLRSMDEDYHYCWFSEDVM